VLSIEWANPSPDNCTFQVPQWSMEPVPMMQNMNMHTVNHGIPPWPTGTARAALDFSNSGDSSSLGEIVSYFDLIFYLKYMNFLNLSSDFGVAWVHI